MCSAGFLLITQDEVGRLSAFCAPSPVLRCLCFNDYVELSIPTGAWLHIFLTTADADVGLLF